MVKGALGGNASIQRNWVLKKSEGMYKFVYLRFISKTSASGLKKESDEKIENKFEAIRLINTYMSSAILGIWTR